MAKKSGLGDNYQDLFGEDPLADENEAITSLNINEIEPNRDQPRKDFDNEKLADLAESIAAHGIIQPLIVHPCGDGYKIIAGERRWRAARIAGLSQLPVRIMELTDVQVMQVALIENLQREDLNPIEEAMGYRDLIDKYGMKQEDVAKKIGKARSSVTNALRLLSLPDTVLTMVRKGEISKGHCKVLMSAKSDDEILEYAVRIKNSGLSVHALERLMKNAHAERTNTAVSTQTFPPDENAQRDNFYVEAQLSLSNALEKPVRINKTKNKITLEIVLATDDELKEIINKLAI
ncbi:MAG: ParB/RepB/Spo0J family partition protein [Oscillospiraceae bacterium]|nr:ParB/RepB/Spo0J family partition protein [Oscillospiraceae bacterium]